MRAHLEVILGMIRSAMMQQFPYMRLGQFLCNVIPERKDLFYIEDKDLEKYISDFMRKHSTL